MKFLNSYSEITQDFITNHIIPVLPCLVNNDWTILKVGCESFAIDFGDIIVRLPKDQFTLQQLKTESQICKLIDCPDLQTPRPTMVFSEYSFSWHNKLVGDYFLTKDYASLNDTERKSITHALSNFFLHIHSFNVNEIRQYGVQDKRPFISLEKLISHVTKYIPSHLFSGFESVVSTYHKYIGNEPLRVFGHFDVHGWNMAFNPSINKLIGIYDFGDCGVGDIHQDFHPLNTISSDLTKRVIESYNSRSKYQIDIEKVNFYTMLAELDELYHTLYHKPAIMNKGLNHHLSQFERWVECFCRN